MRGRSWGTLGTTRYQAVQGDQEVLERGGKRIDAEIFFLLWRGGGVKCGP